MDDVNKTLATPWDVPPISTSSLLNHEFVTMSDEQARKKWEALLNAAGLSHSIDRFSLLISLASGAPDAPDRFMATIKNHPIDDQERQRILRLFEETVIPLNVPSDDYHFSVLSLRFAYSVDILTGLVAAVPSMTVNKLMCVYSPLMIKFYLDDEMQTYAKANFIQFWSVFAKGPWASQPVLSFVYEKHSASKCLLPAFTASGDRISKPGPYSRKDFEEWMNSVRGNTRNVRASIHSNHNATSHGPLVALLESFSLDTDGDDGNNGSSMDIS